MHNDYKKLLAALSDGSQRALAKLLTIVENRDQGWIEIMKSVQPVTGKTPIVGLTGPAGVGKSTLTCGLVKELVRQGQKPAIIAVDPSSPFSGGSLLGDRCRMRAVETLPGVFIRSMGSREGTGGLSPAIMDAARLMEAGGHDIVIIETVGTGQDEIDIVHAANLVLLVLAPGMGDMVQAFKAGVMEIADVFVINKAEMPGANELAGEIHIMTTLLQSPDVQIPPIMETSANLGNGVAELASLVKARVEGTQISSERNRRRVRWELINHVEMRIRQMIFDKYLNESSLDQHVTRILDGNTDLFSVVETVLRETGN